MRTLQVKDGKLSFAVEDIDFLPRNQAYLQLTWNPQYEVEDYTLMTLDDYNQMFGGVGVVDEAMTVDVYGIDGRLIKAGIGKEEVPSLGKGVYILKSASASEKMIVR